ncbi:MAG TPA: phosphoglycerate mutase family protein [Bacteroidales bacterium]|nr:phosphoglycerate mutase family protein [Bacteroidales bacterium]
MLTLAFVRHSIAENTEHTHDDFNRKLTEEGIERIRLVLPKIPKSFLQNAFFLHSPAIRCVQTVNYFASYFQIANEQIKEHDFLFSCFRENGFFYFLEEEAANKSNVWIFGHNPMLSNLCDAILGKKFYSLPPCSVVVFKSFAQNWVDIQPENTKLELFINPHQFD